MNEDQLTQRLDAVLLELHQIITRLAEIQDAIGKLRQEIQRISGQPLRL